ncbi:WAT1-related protein [Camellia lanceoleosa]|uniref:WAT1-related protein n=1 Tax=Camellia lanceoleosa TaxID=1840588 RepID=A0ACC0IPC3_9ERIC|nr:WAT1-related protein [Camellia lanceoleosa]
MERLGLGRMIGKAKVAGTLMCTGGAMLLTFYKGAALNIWSTNVHLFHKGGHVASPHPRDRNDIVGLLLVLSCCISIATALIVQAKMIQDYPCVYSSTALTTTMAAIQAIGYALCIDRDWSKWKLGWNLRLLTVSYSGIVACGVAFLLTVWCVQIKGPLFVSVFSRLLFFVLGAVVIVCGLYMVLWGKSKELKRIPQLMPSKSSKESEHIDVIVTSSTENNNGSSDNIVAVEEEEEEEISSEVSSQEIVEI